MTATARATTTAATFSGARSRYAASARQPSQVSHGKAWFAPGWWPIHGRDRPGPATRLTGQCRRSSFKTFLETEIAANVQRAAQGIQTFLSSDRLLTKKIEGLVTQFGMRRLQSSAYLFMFRLGPYCPCLTHIGKL